MANDNRFYPVEGYRPYYETPDGRVYYGAPVTFEDPNHRNYRDQVGAPSTFSYGGYYGGAAQPDRFRRDWRDHGHGSPFPHGDHGVAPLEQVYRLQDPGWWMNGGFPHEGYRIRLPVHHTGDEERHKQKTMTLWVPMCCQDCERKLKTQLENTEGVESVTTDQISNKVVVIGIMRSEIVLDRARRYKPESQLWSDRPAYRQ